MQHEITRYIKAYVLLRLVRQDKQLAIYLNFGQSLN